MKPRTLLILAGIAGAVYLVWRYTRSRTLVTTTQGGTERSRVIGMNEWHPPTIDPNNGGWQPPRLPPVVLDPGGLGPEHPPLIGGLYDGGDPMLIGDAHLAEDSGTNQPESGSFGPFQKQPLEFLSVES